jgi:uncharacterized protein YjbI with pentapeptide repeats
LSTFSAPKTVIKISNNLRNADLRVANLNGADLRGAKNIPLSEEEAKEYGASDTSKSYLTS